MMRLRFGNQCRQVGATLESPREQEVGPDNAGNDPKKATGKWKTKTWLLTGRKWEFQIGSEGNLREENNALGKVSVVRNVTGIQHRH